MKLKNSVAPLGEDLTTIYQNMKKKKTHIYNLLNEVCDIINYQLHTRPIVYGSIGVELILNKDFDASDIDIILSDEVYFNKDRLDKVMLKNGYQLLDMPYHSYIKQGISIEFANYNYWKDICYFSDSDFVGVSQKERQYTVLPLENQIKLYQYLTNLITRSNQKKIRDQAKLDALINFRQR